MAVHQVVRNKLVEIQDVCRHLGVRRLDLFGSAVGSSFDPRHSDADVLVEFDTRPDFDYVDAYFGLKEELERLLERPVDVVTIGSVRNPYFRDEVMRSRETLYAA